MLSTVRSYVLDAITARPVRVEVDVHRGLRGFAIVGLPEAAVRETRERVRAAVVNSGFEFPLTRIVVNLAPASLRKAGPGLDLPIAVGLLLASEQLQPDVATRFAFVGDLALDGTLLSTPGIVQIAEAARDEGAEALVMPEQAGTEAALARDVDLIGLDALQRMAALAAGDWEPKRPTPLPVVECQKPDFAAIRGQRLLRRAAEVAAAGGHSLFMQGPPGSGTSMIAGRLPTILPPLSDAERLEVARIASATDRLNSHQISQRPFRAPHHSISGPGLAGGGMPPRPGEATLAHRGILYLADLDRFQVAALRELVPIRYMGQAPVRGQLLPADFILIASSVGDRGDVGTDGLTGKDAASEATVVDHLDFDLIVSARVPSTDEISGQPGEPSADIRVRVILARQRQERRLDPGRLNAGMSTDETHQCELTPDAMRLVAELLGSWDAFDPFQGRLIRVAQTLADLGDRDRIEEADVRAADELYRR